MREEKLKEDTFVVKQTKSNVSQNNNKPHEVLKILCYISITTFIIINKYIHVSWKKPCFNVN